MATIREFIKILKDAAATYLICRENICLSVVEEQEQAATSGTSRPRVESRITESNALWRSTRLCDFRVLDAIESIAVLQRYIFRLSARHLFARLLGY